MMRRDDADDRLDRIAVVGMAGRFPGARNIDEFWNNLREGVESITFFSDDELVAEGIDPALVKNPKYVKAAAIVDDIELFDARFFGFSPREAQVTDPQHRLFLECAWQALEDANCDSLRYEGRVGVYAGVGMSDYSARVYSSPETAVSDEFIQIAIGNEKDHLPARVSYKLNLKGPSINVQTTCSSSLVAVHLACQSLLVGESDMALAGGATLAIPHRTGYLYQEGGIMSPDGHCRAFDARARGTVGGNGVGIVVLKRLDDALADGDVIHAVICGSALNNDGSVKIGYTAPSVEGQAEVISDAISIAGIDPETITYIEAHGTGTQLGDPIEVAALMRAFHGRNSKRRCAIGSVKTNIGHLDAAAGVAGLIKTVLALKHAMLPPSLHFESPNPEINFDGSPFYVNAGLSEWKPANTPRRAGVSSFGIGGTNAHVILEEAPAREESGQSRPWQLLMLSAKSLGALETATDNLTGYFKNSDGLSLPDAAYTLQIGRRPFSHRRILVSQSTNDAIAELGNSASSRVITGFSEEKKPAVVFMFPGQGSQYVNMGRDLYEQEEIFRREIDRCSEFLEEDLGVDLRRILYPPRGMEQEAQQKLDQTRFTQPALCVVELALAELLMRWGILPSAMIGHSIGEYTAAAIAGVMSKEQCLRLVAARARMMQQLTEGAMLAVAMTEDEAQRVAGEELSVAAVNADQSCVLSGRKEAIDELEKLLDERAIQSHRLRTSHAFHSQMVQGVAERLPGLVKDLDLRKPRIAYVSNLTGKWITGEEALDPKYWGRQLRECVRFGAGIGEILKRGRAAFLEVGPGLTLCGLAKQSRTAEDQRLVFSTLGRGLDGKNDFEKLLTALGKLWIAGIEPDWDKYYEAESRQKVLLPTYPFERKRYWVDPLKRKARRDLESARRKNVLQTSRQQTAAAVRQSQQLESPDDLEQALIGQLAVLSRQLTLLQKIRES